MTNLQAWLGPVAVAALSPSLGFVFPCISVVSKGSLYMAGKAVLTLCRSYGPECCRKWSLWNLLIGQAWTDTHSRAG